MGNWIARKHDVRILMSFEQTPTISLLKVSAATYFAVVIHYLVEDEYEVEEILQMESRILPTGQTAIYYFTKWVGYNADENTWEPEENFLINGVVCAALTKFREKKSDELQCTGSKPAEAASRPQKKIRALRSNTSL